MQGRIAGGGDAGKSAFLKADNALHPQTHTQTHTRASLKLQ